MHARASISTLFFLLIAMAARADETFSVLAPFKYPVKMPAPIHAYLTSAASPSAQASCHTQDPLDLFEAQIVTLNKSTKAYLVKPAHPCLCLAAACPVWMFQMKGKVATLIWSIPETSVIDVLDKQLNGYRKLNETSSAATQGSESTWSWDRNRYTEIYKNAWRMDADNKCRLGQETIQLMDGKMVNHTIKCPQD